MADLAVIVDQLGYLKAQIASLKAEETKLCDTLKAAHELTRGGVAAEEGNVFRATISMSDPSPQVDYRGLVEKLVAEGVITPQRLAAYTSTPAPSVSCRVVAKRTDGKGAKAPAMAGV